MQVCGHIKIPPSCAQHLHTLLHADAVLMQALHTIHALHLPDAWLGAGAIRNRVWDHLHGWVTPSGGELDLVYFDASNSDPAHEQAVQRQLQQSCPGWQWDVTNQAGVHLWYRDQRHAIAPLQSTADGVAGWPETATAIAVRLNAAQQLELLAPCGLQDLFGLVLRHNPHRVSYATFLERVQVKQFLQRWPGLRLL